LVIRTQISAAAAVLNALCRPQLFKHGGVIVISHNVKFVNALCNEWWTVDKGEGVSQVRAPC
jgi:ABC-type dipeptide/oligopeptide/nickel transport system ATPase subunit